MPVATAAMEGAADEAADDRTAAAAAANGRAAADADAAVITVGDAAAEPALPAGWRSALDAAGDRYFYNDAGEVTWAPPADGAAGNGGGGGGVVAVD